MFQIVIGPILMLAAGVLTGWLNNKIAWARFEGSFLEWKKGVNAKFDHQSGVNSEIFGRLNESKDNFGKVAERVSSIEGQLKAKAMGAKG